MTDQPTTTPTPPASVQPGQMWRDNDQRTQGAGEFTVLAVEDLTVGYAVAIVKRASGRRATIRVDRLLEDSDTQRGYTYLGMAR